MLAACWKIKIFLRYLIVRIVNIISPIGRMGINPHAALAITSSYVCHFHSFHLAGRLEYLAIESTLVKLMRPPHKLFAKLYIDPEKP